MWIKKSSRRIFRNNCSWCIFSPLEEWLYGIRIFQFRCYHRAPQNYQKTSISKRFIFISTFFFAFGSYSTIEMWRELENENNLNSNNMKLVCSYFITGILMVASIFTCAIKSKSRLAEIKGMSRILESAKTYGMLNIFSHKEVKSLRKRTTIYRNAILTLLVILFVIYLDEIYLCLEVSHLKWFLILGTSYFFHAVIFLYLSNLKVYQEAFKNNAKRIMNCMKQRNYCKGRRSFKLTKSTKVIEEDGLKENISNTIRLHGAIYRNLNFFLDFWTFSVPALLLLLTAYVVLISTLLINDSFMFRTMSVPVLMDNIIMSMISVSPTFSIIFIMRLADSLLEPVRYLLNLLNLTTVH